MKKLLLLSTLCVFAQVRTEIPEMTEEQKTQLEEVAHVIPPYIEYLHTIYHANRLEELLSNENLYKQLKTLDQECSNVNALNFSMCQELYTLFSENKLEYKGEPIADQTHTSAGLDEYLEKLYPRSFYNNLRKFNGVTIIE